ncbi:DUF2254 domain-containing protein [Nocardioides abyssi]|uniref:DUF2254 domain-containing protein n=1 Tax=Nocardioides abyssi TaxID=3058370 RepID=A0ABT8ETX7_9ACTN|nr:DUF2254 domain-containing protein [Nocardioides abyssi]MDN4161549.1 DUF2254 domain-containing protein [Nocardioides abyssi]
MFSRASDPAGVLRWSGVRYRFRESLFQLPALLVVAGIVLAEVTARLDEAWPGAADGPWTLSIGSTAATWLLSTVAGAMITTAGVVFSLTVVSLQLASSQFSPRVMRSFIRDRLSQVVIGLLVATFTYCVLTLRHVDEESARDAPALSLTTAVVLTVVTVLLIIAHLNHLAGRLQVGQVVRAIAEEGEETLAAMARQTAWERSSGAMVDTEDAAEHDVTSLDPQALHVLAERDGWVTQASTRLLLRAVPPGSTVRLETRTGAYVHEGEVLASVTPRPDDVRRVTRAVAATVTVDEVRTMQQDVDFALRQLVDVGLRALSPAVNDPTTAVEVVLRVGGLVRRLLAVDPPATAVRGDGDRLLLRPWVLTHEEYVGHAFDQLRQSAGSQTQVLAALMRTLRMLVAHAEQVDRTDRVPALEEQLRLVTESVERADLAPADRERLLAVRADRTDPAEHVTARQPPGR